jgi:uncharacterized surface protein with fasciclin (FAS1) repeats
MKTTLVTTALVAFAVGSTSIAVAPQQKDIVDTAVSAGSFTTLVSLVKQAELVDALKGKGPFTVFAPNDEAFKKLPEATVKAVTSDKNLLTQVLLYHVINGAVPSSAVIQARTVKPDTLLKQGNTAAKLDIRVVDGKVRVNNATVIAADVRASNGVIHVIDNVLIPPRPAANSGRMGGTQLSTNGNGGCSGCSSK